MAKSEVPESDHTKDKYPSQNMLDESSTETPLVSAVLTTRNRVTLLARALDSVVAQTYSALEIIVVDDGSEDETRTLLRAYGSMPHVTVLRNEKPSGPCAARNQGIGRARGLFVAGLDDDDFWDRHRIECLVAGYLDSESCITSDVRILRPEGSYIWRRKELISLDDLLYSNVVGNQVLVRRDRVLAVGGYDEHLEAAQDYDLWVRICKLFGPIRNVRKPLQTIDQRHGSQRITDSAKQYRGYLDFYNKHKELMSRSQRRYQLYSIRQKAGRSMRTRTALKYIPVRMWPREIRRQLLEHGVAPLRKAFSRH